MSTTKVPVNIQSKEDFLQSNLKYGDRVHVVVAGGSSSDEAILGGVTTEGINIRVDGYVFTTNVVLLWGDIIELWSAEEGAYSKDDVLDSFDQHLM
ncbi:MAG: hypothetical protein Q8O83_00995 [bacterium]|nr:hypothetical protein [bacterium]